MRLRMFLGLTAGIALSFACAGSTTTAVPEPPEAEPAAVADAPDEAGVATPPVDAPVEPASGVADAAPAPAPAAVPQAGLPDDLDPSSTRPNQRESALMDKYRKQAGATPILLEVIQTDPDVHVKIVSADMIKGRWKAGTDPAASQSAITWCAKNGSASELQGKCLRILGDLGDSRVGATLAGYVGASDKEVASSAKEGCAAWAERYPNQAADYKDVCRLKLE